MPLDAVTQNQRTDADNLYAAPDGDGAGISHTVLGLSIGVPIRGTITLRDRRRFVTSAQVMVADMRADDRWRHRGRTEQSFWPVSACGLRASPLFQSGLAGCSAVS
jgi:hypothetical protein